MEEHYIFRNRLVQLKNENGKIAKLSGNIVVPKLQWGPYLAETDWDRFEKINPNKKVSKEFSEFLSGKRAVYYEWIMPNPTQPFTWETENGKRIKVFDTDLIYKYRETHMPWTLDSRINSFLIGGLDNTVFWDEDYDDKYEPVERYMIEEGERDDPNNGGYFLIGHIPIMYYCI
ncbi:MAG: hypothetical protein PHH54_03255 [Candidatus Nanoarchaeia archaeon]|nr:hypothetical protein [Candidatus Nanoarchaeia archaeon]MDD5740974.1 hypothetical protein [Candidatus Nanoarchaeia archaeon]